MVPLLAAGCSGTPGWVFQGDNFGKQVDLLW